MIGPLGALKFYQISDADYVKIPSASKFGTEGSSEFPVGIEPLKPKAIGGIPDCMVSSYSRCM